MPHDNTGPPSAALSVGDLSAFGLHGTPVAAQDTVPGAVGIILGFTPNSQPVIIGITSLEWLDDLEAAVQAARARGIVQAGMTAVLT
jgi:hypothetical protein